MADYKLILPSMGEGVMEATVTQWLKSVGDKIEEDESVVEIATDKVDSDVPCPVEGTLKEILVDVDGIAKVGEAIAIVEIEGENAAEQPQTEEATSTSAESTTPQEAKETTEELTKALKQTEQPTLPEDGNFYSPLVKSMAKKENITAAELQSIKGSGQNGRVTKHDVEAFLKNRSSQPAAASATTSASTPSPAATMFDNSTPVVAGPNEEIIEMDRMRKLIAKYMVESKHTAPHVSSFVETDMTNVVLWRNKIKNDFLKREGEKITFMPIIISAIIKAIKDFPMINVSVQGDKIIKKNNINIGIAAARPDGNLIVPVIKNADQYNLVGLTKKINDLAHRARNNQLKPDEIKGGTYTVSNIGSFGNILGTPIINQPEVAIMAVGSIEKKPAVVSSPTGDMIAIRHKMYLSHSYDHRVVDGALGGMFVKRVSDYLESFDIETEI